MALQNYLDFEKPIIDLEQKILEMRKMSDKLDISNEINKLETKVNTLRKEIFENLTPWQIVQLARHPERPPDRRSHWASGRAP